MFGFKVFACFFLFVFLGVLALLCKENAATLFGVTLLVEYFLFDRTWAGWRKKLIWLVPITCILVGLILYFFASIRGIRFENLLEDVSILTRESRTIDRFSYLCTQFSVFVQYVRLLFFPVGQNLDYMMPFKRGFFDGYTPLAFLFVVFVLVLGFWNIRKRPAVSFGIFWFFVTLSIESSIFPISDAIFEHRLYLPMFGFAVAVVYSVFDLFQDREKWAVAILSVAFLALSAGTYLRNQIWKDPVMLWADVTSKSPHNHRAYYNLGNVLQRRGKLDEALLQYEKALQLRPNFAVAHDNMGLIFMAKGNIPEAVKHTGMAVRIRPGNAIIQNNYGQLLLRQGRIEEAAKHFYQAVRIKPRYAKAQNNLGIALAQQKKLKEAKEHLLLAARLDPNNPEILNNVGQVFMLQGNSKEAVRYFEATIQQNPNFAQALTNLGFMRLKENRMDEAAQYFHRALAVAPDMGRARQGLNLAIKAKGSWGPRR
ncbi:tetratricopeptide repeat protein [delta proteobacterium NaphS2]|nr:tetratricopeptide repeat protein [delta proteobacterium NaphS2]